MTIALVIASMGVGGAERAVAELPPAVDLLIGEAAR